MFSFLNKFMLRSLFIKSLFILVLPLSAEFAMNEKDSTHVDGFTQQQITQQQNVPIEGPTENINSMQGNINTKGAEEIKENTEYLISTPGGVEGLEQGGEKKGEFKGEEVKVYTKKAGEGDSEDEHNEDAKEERYFKKMSKYEKPFHSVRATVGFFEGLYGYSKDVELNCSESLIFFYRRATFLFFCPLLFNSLLNFIFEIDNKPSGGYFNFFSVGWRTLPFLKIITFDIHFNWFLFAVSAWFDFVYFPTGFKNKHLFSDNSHKLFHKLSFIPMFLFAFVFDAVSLCVNFKVDDYFYITVNLSYVLQEIVGSLLYLCVQNFNGTESSVCGHCTICTERNLQTCLKAAGNKGNVNIPQNNSRFVKRPVFNLGRTYETVENIGNNKANLNNIHTNNMYEVGMNNFSFRNQYFPNGDQYIPYNSGYFGGENNMNSQFNKDTNNNIYNEEEINMNSQFNNNTNINNNFSRNVGGLENNLSNNNKYNKGNLLISSDSEGEMENINEDLESAFMKNDKNPKQHQKSYPNVAENEAQAGNGISGYEDLLKSQQNIIKKKKKLKKIEFSE